MAEPARKRIAAVACGVGLFVAGCAAGLKPEPYFVSNYTGDGSGQAEHASLADFYARENPLGLHYECYYMDGSGPPFQADIKARGGISVAVNRGDLYAYPITPLPPGFRFYNGSGHITTDHTVAPGRYEIIVKVVTLGGAADIRKFGPREPLVLSFTIPGYRVLGSGCIP